MVRTSATALVAWLALCNAAHAQSLTTYKYDTLGRVTAVGASEGSLTVYGYDPTGNRTTVSGFRVDQHMQSWEAESLPHNVGYADGEGWAASVSNGPQHMTYGPYTTNISIGDHVAAWKLMVDNVTADNADVVQIDIGDATTYETLASRTLTRKEWASAWKYQYFYLPFTLDAGHAAHPIELRTFYKATSYVRVDRIGVADLVYHDGDAATGWTRTWEAESLPHRIGYAEGDGWAADIYQPLDCLTYGPYSTDITPGRHVAVWKMLVDNATADNGQLVKLDIWDATANALIAETVLYRTAWSAANQYEYFGLPFTLPTDKAGHALEFRTFYYGYSHVRIDKIGLK